MAFAITPVVAKDGNQNTIAGGVDFIDTSGVGTGPWIITKVTIDAAGVNVQGVLSNGAAKVDLASAAGTALAATASGLKVDGSAVTQPVSGTFWQATQPVSGTFWQATQPVSGTVTARVNDGSGTSITSTGGALDINIKSGGGSGGTALADEAAFTEGTTSFTPVGGYFKTSPTNLTTGQGGALSLTNDRAAFTNLHKIAETAVAAGNGATTGGTLRVTLSNDSTGQVAVAGTAAVSGTFWQATQPVSAASLPLPSGAATSALQSTINTTLGTPMQNSGGSVTANQGGTWTVQPGNTANTTAWKVDGSAVTQPVSGTFWQTTQPVSAASLPLPSGAATSALQTTINTTLGSPFQAGGSVKVTDGTNTMAVKAASTIAAATDPSAVFTLSPNSYGVLTAGTAGSASAQVVSVQGIASMTPLLVSTSAATTGAYSYSHISTDTTTTVKSGAGTLHTINVNTLAATGTITVYDNTAGSGTVIAIIGGGVQVSYLYDVAFATGLTIVTATAAPDITVSYK